MEIKETKVEEQRRQNNFKIASLYILNDNRSYQKKLISFYDEVTNLIRKHNCTKTISFFL